MNPTIGRIVLYNTTAEDQRRINEHPFNTPQEQSPALVVAVTNEGINLKVMIDGWGELYKKDVKEGTEPGEWSWPKITDVPKEKTKPADAKDKPKATEPEKPAENA